MGDKTGIQWTDATWRSIPGFPDYDASDDGQIRSRKHRLPRILRPISSRDGHLYVFLYVNGRMRKMWVHHAVLLAFVGSAAAGEQCRHLNGHAGDNALTNLCWGTAQENSDDKQRHGTQARGEASSAHKLTERDVLRLQSEIHHFSLRELAKRYGVSHTAIRRAALGIKWGHLQAEAPNGR